jgi:hypothetical protein
MIHCAAFQDYDVTFETSHQYYPRSPGARTDITQAMTGAIV